jgi:hypothetical protein
MLRRPVPFSRTSPLGTKPLLLKDSFARICPLGHGSFRALLGVYQRQQSFPPQWSTARRPEAERKLLSVSRQPLQSHAIVGSSPEVFAIQQSQTGPNSCARVVEPLEPWSGSPLS